MVRSNAETMASSRSSSSRTTPSSPTTRAGHGLPTQSPTIDEYSSPVQRTGKWRAQRSAEQDSGLLSKEMAARILVKEHECAMCEIGIGPDHVENELWLWYGRPTLIDRVYDLGEGVEPLHEKQKVWLSSSPGAPGQQWFKICGTCARRCDLPECLRVLDVPDWVASGSLFARNLHVEAAILTLQWLQLFLSVTLAAVARIVASLYPSLTMAYAPLHRQMAALLSPRSAPVRGERQLPSSLPLQQQSYSSSPRPRANGGTGEALEALRRYCAPSSGGGSSLSA